MPGTHLLPPNLLKLFAPRPTPVYTRPVDKDIDRVTKKDVSGVGPLLVLLKEGAMAGLANGTTDGMEEGEEPTFTLAEEIKRQVRREERKKKRADEFQVAKDSCTCSSSLSMVLLPKLRFPDKPQEDGQAVGDPYKTLFISRLVCFSSTCIIARADQYPQHKNATENDLRREFEMYGTIERVRIVKDKKGRSRGYAFVVYERERDMKGY
jgi:U1 small nuclear ribonucleoprotein